MNRYDLPLAAPSTQTILPVMTQDGIVKGFYPITSTVFAGTEPTYTTTDGVVVPLKVVTVDANPRLHTVTQYMAAVFPTGLAYNYAPWSSVDLIAGDDGYYSWWSMPTQGWLLHFGKGLFINAIQSNLAPVVPSAVTPSNPNVVNGAMQWRTSLKYTALLGDCSFFDFNWMDAFSAKSTAQPQRIQVLTNPPVVGPATVPPMKATVLGIPQASGDGVLFNTIRIMRLLTVAPGDYVFTFKVFDQAGLSTTVTFTLTIL